MALNTNTNMLLSSTKTVTCFDAYGAKYYISVPDVCYNRIVDTVAKFERDLVDFDSNDLEKACILTLKYSTNISSYFSSLYDIGLYAHYDNFLITEHFRKQINTIYENWLDTI